MNIVLQIIILLLSLFFYIHVYNHIYFSNILDLFFIPEYNLFDVNKLIENKNCFYFEYFNKSNLNLLKNELSPNSLYKSISYNHFLKLNEKVPTQYSLYCRNFIFVKSGRVEIKLIPPKNKEHLYMTFRFDKQNFESSLDIWDSNDTFTQNVLKNCDVLTATISENNIFLYLLIGLIV